MLVRECVCLGVCSCECARRYLCNSLTSTPRRIGAVTVGIACGLEGLFRHPLAHLLRFQHPCVFMHIISKETNICEREIGIDGNVYVKERQLHE